jgi:hypothetical protein
MAAQNVETRADRGFRPNGSHYLSDIENVNVTNGNLNLSIPLAVLPRDRGESLVEITANYNSASWDYNLRYAFYPGSGNLLTYDLVNSQYGGWRTIGATYKPVQESRPVAIGEFNCGIEEHQYSQKASLAMPDGSVKALRLYGQRDRFFDGYYAYDLQGQPICPGRPEENIAPRIPPSSN